MRSLKFKQLILGGWDLSEFWLLACTNLKKNNAMILESSVYDSQSGGLKGLIKKVFLLRICRVYCSGQLHVRLLEKLNYKGDKRITSGVGLMNKLSTRPAFDRQEKTFSGKLIFVGRLSPEKGLKHLLQFLADQPQLSLAIVGDGPQRPELQAMATDNIRFHGYVNNDQMGQMFTDYDAFILPSVSEPWGLVIEEALYFGLPVICSDRVGSSLDLVETLKTGTVFKLNDDLSLKNSMDALGKDYKSYFNSVQQLNFEKLKFKQIDSYSV